MLSIEINKIYNEDCIAGMKKMEDQSVTMTLTDIPYGEVSKNGVERARYVGQLRKLDKGKSDEVTFDLYEFLDEVARVTEGGIYIFCGIEQIEPIYTYFKETQKKNFMARQCVWRKTNPSPANGQHMWLSSFENCIFAKRRKTKFNQSCKSSVWEFPVGRGKIHPTEKPLSLFKYLIESSSDKGDVLFDPCIGSGTTAVGAQELGRNYIGFELDEKYYNVAIERIKKSAIKLV